jgi:hypothetical protein
MVTVISLSMPPESAAARACQTVACHPPLFSSELVVMLPQNVC